MTGSLTKTICFFNSNRAWGGGEKWHFSICKELTREGFKTILVTHTHSPLRVKAQQEKLNVFSFAIGNLSFLNPVKLLVLILFFKIKKVDTLILNLPADLKVAGIAAKLSGVKNIIYRRGMPHPLRATFLNRFLFTKILTKIIINSKEISRSLSQGNEDWFPQEKLVLIYNGINLNQTLDLHEKLYLKKDGEFIIGNAGRLTLQKGQKYLIELAEKLKERKLHFKILIAGEGELKKEIEQLIKSKQLEDEVTLLGHVSEMQLFMNSIDLFVFPSLFEGSANTLIETLFYQKPIIAFNISSNPEIIEHERNGYLARPFDGEDLLHGTLELMQSPQKRSQYVEQGLIILKEKFDNKNILQLIKDSI